MMSKAKPGLHANSATEVGTCRRKNTCLSCVQHETTQTDEISILCTIERTGQRGARHWSDGWTGGVSPAFLFRHACPSKITQEHHKQKNGIVRRSCTCTLLKKRTNMNLVNIDQPPNGIWNGAEKKHASNNSTNNNNKNKNNGTVNNAVKTPTPNPKQSH